MTIVCRIGLHVILSEAKDLSASPRLSGYFKESLFLEKLLAQIAITCPDIQQIHPRSQLLKIDPLFANTGLLFPRIGRFHDSCCEISI
jgi:hypothetical protein